MTNQEQIDALKAQVNRFREILSNIDKDNYDEPTFVIQDALSLTSEQCLAEVKAKAIEDAVGDTFDEIDCVTPFDLRFYANRLREQAK